MYNADIPTRADLPTSRQLIRSTVIALLSAEAILVTVVLPAEYGIDPTGIGRLLGLAEMGEIKTQLADEAEKGRIRDQGGPGPAAPAGSQSKVHLFDAISALLLISPAAAQSASPGRTDEVVVTLEPGEGTEVKLVMRKGATANFSWTFAGGVVNYDLHGDGEGRSTSYEKGRAVPGHTGVLQAAFDGNHGWFWRNRGQSDVMVTLRTDGSYSEVKRIL